MHVLRLFWAAIAIVSAAAAPAGRSVPLVFTPNHGQAPDAARFVARTPRLNVYFLRREAVFEMRGAALWIEFLDGNGDADVAPEQRASGVANFLVGGEEEWITGVPLFDGVTYRDIYPGIDARYSGSGSDLKSEYVVAPGHDPARIRLRYAGADGLEIAPDGSLSIRVGRHVLRESAPVIYQDRGGERLRVEGGFQVSGDVVTFVLGGYDHALPLVIDPVFSYLTLLGGSSSDAAMSLAVDAAGSAYLAGFTSSYDMPVANSAQSVSGGGNDVFVAKFAPDGSSLLYCTYIGGRGDDRAYGIAVDSTGAAYVTGSTGSSNFPVRGGLQAKLAGGRNAFVLKLSPAGNALVYSTYLGGGGSDTANAIALDASRNAYVAGDTTSANFPAAGYQTSNRGAPDGFVAKVAADGSRLLYSTYLGGAGEDHANSIAVDASGSAVITGSTYSPDFPVANAYQSRLGGGQDAFVTKFSADGKSLAFSTYLGGSGGMLGAPEMAHGIALDSAGNSYVTGETSSTNFPTRGPLQATNAGWQDGFVSKFGPTGTLLYSTYLGGVNLDGANAIAVDASGSAYVAGQTTSPSLASQLMYQGVPTGVSDVFVVKLSAAGDAIAGWNYFGGMGADTATAVAVDGSSNLYIAGWTQSPNFAVVNGFQSINGGNYGAFLGKMSFGASSITVTVGPASATLAAGQTQQFTATVVNVSNTAVTWSLNPAVGSISAAGLYTAPSAVALQQTVTVRATSIADPSKSGSATVTLAPVAVAVSPATATLGAGRTQQFTATVSNTSNSAVAWSVSPAGAGTISAAGLYTAPSSVASAQTVTITATSVADTSKSATATVTLAPVAVTVSPGTASLSASQTQQFTATVSNTSNGAVTWSVSPAGAGTISAAGLYTAPASVASAQTVTVTATSAADVSKSATATVTLAPVTITVSPATVSLSASQTQQFTATVSSGSVTWSVSPSGVGTISAAGLYTAPASVASAQTVTIKATSAVDASKSATATVTLTPVTIAVSPGSVSLSASQTQQFTATVSSGSVTWSVSPSGAGTISAAGLYTAPASVASAQTVTVTATSSADASKSATASVNLTPGSVTSNLALGKVATQSSTVAPAALAVDGNTDGNYFDGSVAHTEADANAWWQVDLGASYSISAITLWNRTECCGDRLSDYWVFVSDTPFTSLETPTTLQGRAGTWSAHQTTAPQPSATVTPNAQGRYVRVQLSGTNNLQLAEVQVFGSVPGVTVAPAAVTLSPGGSQQFTAAIQGSPGAAVTWSISPNVGSITAGGVYTAPASVGAAQAVVVTARGVADPSKMASATVSLRMSGVLANLALGKAASQSSTMGTGPAAAVDGNTDGNYWNASVSQTNPDANAWWQVDLGAAATIGSVTIWNRTDCCGSRLADYWVFVSSTPFAAGDTPATLQGRSGVWSSHQTAAPDPSATIPVAAHGRYVRIQLSGTNSLHMAEVQVFGAWLTDDIAIGKQASESTTWAPASLAVDGNTDGSYFNGSVMQTEADANAWWQVDLGATAGVGSIAIWNRTDCCAGRLSDFWVFVSNTPFAASDTPATLQSRAGTWSSHQTTAPNPTVVIPAGVAGRYVRVQLSGTNNLHMAEVEVFGAYP